MAFDAYLKIDGIEGEAKDKNHNGWIQLLAVNHNLVQTGTEATAGGAHSSGRINHADVACVKSMDSSSPNLYLSCCNGKSHKTATIEFQRAVGDKQQVFYKIELTDVLISSVSPSVSGDFPTESFGLKYGTIKWTYTKTDTDGKATGDVVAGWNVKENVKL